MRKQIPQIDLSKTDFLAAQNYPSFLLYNPLGENRTVSVAIGAKMADIYDLTVHRIIARGVAGSTPIVVESGQARVLVVVPAGSKGSSAKGVLHFDDVAVDYNLA